MRAYRHVGSGELRALGAAIPAGAGVCHLEADSGGEFLVASCHGDGRVALIGLDTAGALVGRHEGPGCRARGPEEPGARCAGAARWTGPEYGPRPEPDQRLAVQAGPRSPAPAGGRLPRRQRTTSPRSALGRLHLRHHGSLERVGGARADTQGSLRTAGSVSLRPDQKAGEFAAHVTVDEARGRVYATVRGSDRVVVLGIEDGGRDLSVIADVDCGVQWPRHHLHAGPWLLVAGQRSSTVVGLPLDDSGIPLTPTWRVAVGSPSCLVLLLFGRD